MIQEAKVVGETRVIKNILNFTAKAIDNHVDMRSICNRCSINDICYGIFYKNYKEAGISLSKPKVKNISSEDSSNCGIIIDLVAKKSERQSGFFPRRGYSPAK